MPAVIDVQHLHKKYADTVAVDDVSFAVEEGEIFGILGPNGAGKTTSVECMVGLRTPDRGEIRILGLDPHRDRAELTQQLGVQLQDGQLPDRLKVAEALELYSSFYRTPADWRALMDSLGLADKANSRSGKLSGGQKQRLETARLAEALGGVADRWSALHGIAVQVTTTGTARTLPPDAELALLRTLQEALANVAKHARAGRAVVTLSYLESEVALDVSDDGRGFDVARLAGPGDQVSGVVVNGVVDDGLLAVAVRPDSGGTDLEAAAPEATYGHSLGDVGSGHPGGSGGFGLVAMRQRIEGLLGTLQVESEPGVGTTISACVPQPNAGARA